MNVSFNTQNHYLNIGLRTQESFLGLQAKNHQRNTGMYNPSNDVGDHAKSDEIKALLKKLNQKTEKAENPYVGTSIYKENGYLQTSSSSEREKDKKLKQFWHYNYKDVSNRIRRAKTSLSAGQAVISAKRKVLEIRRKIASGKEDEQDLQLALTHAKRMEMVARKKKHHLELEEMVQVTQKRDEKLDNMEEASAGSVDERVEAAQETIAQEEDAVFEEREMMLDSITEEIEKSGAGISDEMMTELNEMIAEFGEEELKELEETMEQLENLEVVNPHMSEEDLEELKRKHRSSENKAIMKADMDYIKSMIRHTLEKGSNMQGIQMGASANALTIPSVDVSVGIEVAVPSMDVPSVDIQL